MTQFVLSVLGLGRGIPSHSSMSGRQIKGENISGSSIGTNLLKIQFTADVADVADLRG